MSFLPKIAPVFERTMGIAPKPQNETFCCMSQTTNLQNEATNWQDAAPQKKGHDASVRGLCWL